MKTTLAPTFKSIFKGHEALEIRIKSKSGMSGWFFGKGSGPDIIKLVEEHDGKAEAIYVTLNPINTSALTRTGQQTSQLTTDKDISRRAFILIDVDPVRPADMSSTDEEKEQAYQLILRIKDHLEGIGFPPPHFADSGNGYHLDRKSVV